MSIGRSTITYTSAQTGCSITTFLNVQACKYPQQMTVFPNPAHNELTIFCYPDIIHAYTIMDNVGRVLQKRDVTALYTSVDITSIPCGLFFVILNGDERNFLFKLAKE